MEDDVGRSCEVAFESPSATLRDLPFTPDRVLAALRTQEEAE
jgi:hypothetical protein